MWPVFVRFLEESLARKKRFRDYLTFKNHNKFSSQNIVPKGMKKSLKVSKRPVQSQVSDPESLNRLDLIMFCKWVLRFFYCWWVSNKIIHGIKKKITYLHYDNLLRSSALVSFLFCGVCNTHLNVDLCDVLLSICFVRNASLHFL